MRERNIDWLPLAHAPNWGLNLQPRHVPWLGIWPVTLRFGGRYPINWATLARAPSFLYFILLNLLGWHWLIQLYRFQVYDAILHHLCVVLCVHHLKSSLLPSPSTLPLPSSTCPHSPSPLVMTRLLSVSMRFFCFFTWSLRFFTQPPTPFPSDSCPSVLCIYESVCILFVCFVH